MGNPAQATLMATGRLTKRADFLAAAQGRKAHGALLTLQAKPRGDESEARLGFTVTRKVGTATERNRIRRRLRAVTRAIADEAALPGHDYVIVARRAVLDAPFDVLTTALGAAFRRVHAAEPKGAPRSRRADDVG